MGFLPKLLELLRDDDDGRGPGMRMHCPRCGIVRAQHVWPKLLGGNEFMFRGACPHCRRIASSEILRAF